MKEHNPRTGRIVRAACPALAVAVCAVLIGLTGCGGLPPADDDAGGGTVVVLVVDEETSAPLEVPATVIAGGVRGVLDPAEEQLVLQNVPIGSGTPPTQPLTATAEGFVTRTQEVQMQVTAATWVTVALTETDRGVTGTVAGTVREAGSGDPVVNAFIRFSAPGTDDDSGVGGYTDSEGRFVIGGIPEGERRVIVEAEDFLPRTPTTVDIVADADGENEDLQFELVAGDTNVSVRGTVVEVLTRLPVEGATVTFGEGAPLETDADGRFRATDVPVGDQTVTVTAEGYDDLTTVIRVLPGMSDVTFEIFEAAGDPPVGPSTIIGTVTLSGAPDNAGATVTAVSLDTESAVAEDETDAAGQFGLFVPPGRYDIRVSFEGRQISREVTVPEGGVIVDGINFVLSV
ncbi:MAG: carboxypeptidase regulatory-like domain-containing protein [Armatimonadota bacterium]